MEDAAALPPRNKPADLPFEMIEEILLTLPVKSLLRFSSVSNLWNSMISEPRFTRKYISRRAAAVGRDRLVVYMNPDIKVNSLHALSSISSNPPIDIEIDYNIEAGDNIFVDCSGQFNRKKPYLRAFCDELLLVGHEESLFLWNPSIRSKGKLSSPLFVVASHRHPNLRGYHNGWGNFIYGLGYDCVVDDYKILKIGRQHIYGYTGTELYSLKNNSWRKVEHPSSARPSWNQERCEFVGGIFHWIGGVENTGDYIIVSFNSSTEKYGEVSLPPDNISWKDGDDLDLAVVRGTLCAYVNSYLRYRLVVWVMEEYGVDKSWTKKFEIPYNGSIQSLQPLYFYDNNDILIRVYDRLHDCIKILLHKNHAEEARPTQVVCSSFDAPGGVIRHQPCDAFLYFESLISPKPKPNANNE